MSMPSEEQIIAINNALQKLFEDNHVQPYEACLIMLALTAKYQGAMYILEGYKGEKARQHFGNMAIDALEAMYDEFAVH